MPSPERFQQNLIPWPFSPSGSWLMAAIKKDRADPTRPYETKKNGITGGLKEINLPETTLSRLSS